MTRVSTCHFHIQPTPVIPRVKGSKSCRASPSGASIASRSLHTKETNTTSFCATLTPFKSRWNTPIYASLFAIRTESIEADSQNIPSWRLSFYPETKGQPPASRSVASHFTFVVGDPRKQQRCGDRRFLVAPLALVRGAPNAIRPPPGAVPVPLSHVRKRVRPPITHFGHLSWATQPSDWPLILSGGQLAPNNRSHIIESSRRTCISHGQPNSTLLPSAHINTSTSFTSNTLPS